MVLRSYNELTPNSDKMPRTFSPERLCFLRKETKSSSAFVVVDSGSVVVGSSSVSVVVDSSSVSFSLDLSFAIASTDVGGLSFAISSARLLGVSALLITFTNFARALSRTLIQSFQDGEFLGSFNRPEAPGPLVSWPRARMSANGVCRQRAGQAIAGNTRQEAVIGRVREELMQMRAGSGEEVPPANSWRRVRFCASEAITAAFFLLFSYNCYRHRFPGP